MEPDELLYTSVQRMFNEKTQEWEDIELLIWDSGYLSWRKWDGVPSANSQNMIE